MMTITRIIFFLANSLLFQNYSLLDFIAGIWVDCITIGIWFIPFYAIYLLPNPFRAKKSFKLVVKGLFHLINTLIIALNLIDVEYFKFTDKRSTSDLFTILGAEQNLSDIISALISDFWWLILVLLLLIYVSNFLYNRIEKIGIKTESKVKLIHQLLLFIGFASLLFIMGRGGLGYRPAGMMTAAKMTKVENTALVLNTPLSIIKTVGKEALTEKKYFDSDSDKIYNPIKTPNEKHSIKKDANVVIIILESFGDEWLGKKNGGPFTPFLDSLIDKSLYFSNGYANGRKSIEAMPAIFASIPTLMDDPYISSHYGTNRINTLPILLKERGYSSAFYHGATNGSMKFDQFASMAGFDHYFGRTEYGNEDHTDDAWGVLDEYFNPWTARSISKELKEPFIAGLFTISSHHPYYIPEEHEKILPEGPLPIAKSIAYGDMSLRKFFDAAKEQPWYKNTIFVICADHAPSAYAKKYSTRIGMYQIPILIFDPTQKIEPKQNDAIFSHIDIMPTILDLVGYDKSYYSFGSSTFQNKIPWTVNYINSTYHFFKGDYMLNFRDNSPINLYNYRIDTLAKKDSLKYYPSLVEKMDLKLKGIIQRYNNDLINNQMTYKK